MLVSRYGQLVERCIVGRSPPHKLLLPDLADPELRLDSMLTASILLLLFDQSIVFSSNAIRKGTYSA